jgi:hypothetical protein
MEKIYPTIKNTYRFLGGSPWNVPKQLWELTVSKGYEITPSGKDDYIVRGASKLIMIDKKQFEFYFEPFVDYFAEPTIIGEEKPTEKPTEAPKKEVKEELDIDLFLKENKEQLSLF